MNKRVIFIIIILIAVIIGGIFFFKGNKQFEETAVIDTKDYEYFVMYAANDKVGIIDRYGKEIVKPVYTDIYIPNPNKDVFVCFTDTASKIINIKGDELFVDYGDVSAITTSEGNSLDFEKELLKYRQNDLYGLIDFSGKKVLDANYTEITSVQNRPGRILVKKDDLYGVVDSNGTFVIPIGYNSIKGDEYNSESEGYLKTGYVVTKKTSSGIMSGYINEKGKKLLDNKFDSISRVLKDDSDVYLIVMQNGRKGVYKNKNQIIEPIYQDILFSRSSNVFIVNKNGKYGFYNLDGRQILQNFYSSYEIAGKYIAVEENGQKSLFDINGNFIEQKNYSRIVEVENNDYIIAVDSQDGTYSIISKEVNIKDNYKNISYLFDDYFSYTNQDDKVGVLSVRQGKVLNADYDLIIPVQGINAIEAKLDNGESTFYSSKMEKISTFSYPIVESLNEKYAVIYNNEDRIYLDNNGEIVSSNEINHNKEIYAFKEDSLWGYKDKSGNVVLDPQYEIATELDDFGFAAIMKNGKWGVVDNKGAIVLEPTLEIETYYYPKFIGKYLIEQIETTHVIEIKGN